MPAEEITFEGKLGRRGFLVRTRPRTVHPAASFITPSNARIHYGMSSRVAADDQYVDVSVVAPKDATDDELARLADMAQAEDSRPVLVRRAADPVRTGVRAPERQPEWLARPVAVVTAPGTSPETVPGAVYGALAVARLHDRSRIGSDRGDWLVVPPGGLPLARFERRRDARAFAQAALPLADWTAFRRTPLDKTPLARDGRPLHMVLSRLKGAIQRNGMERWAEDEAAVAGALDVAAALSPGQPLPDGLVRVGAHWLLLGPAALEAAGAMRGTGRDGALDPSDFSPLARIGTPALIGPSGTPVLVLTGGQAAEVEARLLNLGTSLPRLDLRDGVPRPAALPAAETVTLTIGGCPVQADVDRSRGYVTFRPDGDHRFPFFDPSDGSTPKSWSMADPSVFAVTSDPAEVADMTAAGAPVRFPVTVDTPSGPLTIEAQFTPWDGHWWSRSDLELRVPPTGPRPFTGLRPQFGAGDRPQRGTALETLARDRAQDAVHTFVADAKRILNRTVRVAGKRFDDELRTSWSGVPHLRRQRTAAVQAALAIPGASLGRDLLSAAAKLQLRLERAGVQESDDPVDRLRGAYAKALRRRPALAASAEARALFALPDGAGRAASEGDRHVVDAAKRALMGRAKPLGPEPVVPAEPAGGHRSKADTAQFSLGPRLPGGLIAYKRLPEPPLPSRLPASGDALTLLDGDGREWWYVSISPSTAVGMRTDGAFAAHRDHLVASLEPLAQGCLPIDADQRVHVVGSIVTLVGPPGDTRPVSLAGVTLPLRDADGAVHHHAFAAMTDANPANTLYHEAVHLHLREGRLRDDDLAAFRSADSLRSGERRYGFGGYPPSRWPEEFAAHALAEGAAGSAGRTPDAWRAADDAHRLGRSFAHWDRLATELALGPPARDTFAALAEGVIGRRPTDAAARDTWLREMGYAEGAGDTRIFGAGGLTAAPQFSLGAPPLAADTDRQWIGNHFFVDYRPGFVIPGTADVVDLRDRTAPRVVVQPVDRAMRAMPDGTWDAISGLRYTAELDGAARQVIALPEATLASREFDRVWNHELVHAFRHGGFLDDQEWDALVREPHNARWVDAFAVRHRYPGLGPAELAEEAVCDAFGWWARGGLKGQLAPPPDAEAVFRSIADGSVGRRQPEWQIARRYLRRFGAVPHGQFATDVSYKAAAPTPLPAEPAPPGEPVEPAGILSEAEALGDRPAWDMSRAEYVVARQSDLPPTDPRRTDLEAMRPLLRDHASAVFRAVADGKPVPDKALEGHPALVSMQAAANTVAPSDRSQPVNPLGGDTWERAEATIAVPGPAGWQAVPLPVERCGAFAVHRAVELVPAAWTFRGPERSLDDLRALVAERRNHAEGAEHHYDRRSRLLDAEAVSWVVSRMEAGEPFGDAAAAGLTGARDRFVRKALADALGGTAVPVTAPRTKAGWQISHLPTGLPLVGRGHAIATKTEARRVVDALAGTWPWGEVTYGRLPELVRRAEYRDAYDRWGAAGAALVAVVQARRAVSRAQRETVKAMAGLEQAKSGLAAAEERRETLLGTAPARSVPPAGVIETAYGLGDAHARSRAPAPESAVFIAAEHGYSVVRHRGRDAAAGAGRSFLQETTAMASSASADHVFPHSPFPLSVPEQRAAFASIAEDAADRDLLPIASVPGADGWRFAMGEPANQLRIAAAQAGVPLDDRGADGVAVEVDRIPALQPHLLLPIGEADLRAPGRTLTPVRIGLAGIGVGIAAAAALYPDDARRIAGLNDGELSLAHLAADIDRIGQGADEMATSLAQARQAVNEAQRISGEDAGIADPPAAPAALGPDLGPPIDAVSDTAASHALASQAEALAIEEMRAVLDADPEMRKAFEHLPEVLDLAIAQQEAAEQAEQAAVPALQETSFFEQAVQMGKDLADRVSVIADQLGNVQFSTGHAGAEGLSAMNTGLATVVTAAHATRDALASHAPTLAELAGSVQFSTGDSLLAGEQSAAQALADLAVATDVLLPDVPFTGEAERATAAEQAFDDALMAVKMAAADERREAEQRTALLQVQEAGEHLAAAYYAGRDAEVIGKAGLAGELGERIADALGVVVDSATRTADAVIDRALAASVEPALAPPTVDAASGPAPKRGRGERLTDRLRAAAATVQDGVQHITATTASHAGQVADAMRGVADSALGAARQPVPLGKALATAAASTAAGMAAGAGTALHATGQIPPIAFKSGDERALSAAAGPGDRLQPFFVRPDEAGRADGVLRAQGLSADTLANRLTVTRALLARREKDPAAVPGETAALRAGVDVLSAEATRRTQTAARAPRRGRGHEMG